MWTASRYHDISTGHRVYGHESKCAHAHGHNYRVHFHCAGNLDSVGRVIDFSVIKERLCMWLEDNWDHKFLLWENDPWCDTFKEKDPEGVVIVNFNPTAENMAEYLIKEIAPLQLDGTGVTLIKVDIEETRKCSASYTL
ncbi:COG0720 6-pyruvoyl-tetrahydropterin synthase [uncultured Caudovirales phage]|uniref:COG0720 6-pyruvoyl-tetrahydropterin synthase n=1 Tax=uncultured Caudovirales phage TaxID=2100421 RepID=A0A6J5TB39_9CAUD|nr:COG0720 6-pyruvoyl-tetrahydropterin synthase [uncultured Caudovirales phage]CAB4242141.1 COG0720 6-pyruvoyl-tetrahydropterin synthase [uncultured Caudovirales phage]